MKPLVEFYGGEPWFDNPQLIIANPKKTRRSSMKRSSRRKARRSLRRRARRNFYSAGALANPRRKRSRRTRRSRRSFRRNVYMNPRARRRRFRRNPGGRSFFGITLPPMDAVLFVGAGLIVPPMVSAQIIKFLPDTWKTNQAATWGVKVASVLLPGFALRKFWSPRAGNLFMVGGAASLVVDAIKTFFPGVIPGLGYQPLLGAHFSTVRADRVVPFARAGRGMAPPMLTDAPERLSPTTRF